MNTRSPPPQRSSNKMLFIHSLYCKFFTCEHPRASPNHLTLVFLDYKYICKKRKCKRLVVQKKRSIYNKSGLQLRRAVAFCMFSENKFKAISTVILNYDRLLIMLSCREKKLTLKLNALANNCSGQIKIRKESLMKRARTKTPHSTVRGNQLKTTA